jgi:pyrrolidone-carboxylate peptidase
VSKKILIVSFGSFAGRSVNGSMTVANKVVQDSQTRGLVVDHTVLPVEWTAVGRFLPECQGYDLVVGLGEGFNHVVVVERYAYRSANGKDVVGADPEKEHWTSGDPYLRSAVQLGEIPQAMGDALQLPHPEKVILGSNPGAYLCNALYYRLLQLCDGKPLCFFVHLPPQGEWIERTGLSEADYAGRFAAVVTLVMDRNSLI